MRDAAEIVMTAPDVKPLDAARVDECPKCEHECDWIECRDCDGSGIDGHDCGEDTCMCRDPEDNVRCDTCAGAGGWTRCLNCYPMSAEEASDYYS